MKCKSCDNTLEDVAFIGGLCIDCYSEVMENPRSAAGNIVRRAHERALGALAKRREVAAGREADTEAGE